MDDPRAEKEKAVMTPNIPQAVRSLIAEYQRFLRTSYRFLDPHLRQQFEEHLARADVVVKGPFVTLARDYALGATLRELVEQGRAEPKLLQAHWPRGALATEIACLIRRLKAHANLGAGELIGIGTSATVAAREGSVEALARFASILFGEEVLAGDIIGESYAPRFEEGEGYMPPVPEFDEATLTELDIGDNEAVVALVEKLTGKRCPAKGSIADRVAAVLRGNRVVRALEELFAEPLTVSAAAERIRDRFSERRDVPSEQIRLEVEAYLLVGSLGSDDHPPRLRPKLHTFFHGVYDVALCLNPDCRALVPQGGAECQKCGSAARPAALCRTCGQDFMKVRCEKEDDDLPVGTGDFFSDAHTAFLTHEIRELPEGPGAEDEEAQDAEREKNRHGNRRFQVEGRLEEVGVCPGCGRLLSREGVPCPQCNRVAIRMLLHRGKLNTCPACGDIYTRGDIVTPLRTSTASTVSVLVTHHLDYLEGDDRKLLVFADNRQDAAHQAGYTSDKHRTFALRHLVAHEVRQAGERGLYLTELPERLFDRFQRLGIIPRRPTRPERERWIDALTYQVANEFTRYSRQRASLENLGLVGVDYEFLDEIAEDERFLQAAHVAGAGSLLQLEAGELDAFVRRGPAGTVGEQIVFYETVPGGAGYLEEMTYRLPEVARAAQDVLYRHKCAKACYLCLKHYRNQRWHAFFDKDLVRDVLLSLASLDPVDPEFKEYGEAVKALEQMMTVRVRGSDTTLRRYPKGEIEEPLRAALERLGITDAKTDYEVYSDEGVLITVPDFAWPDLKVAVFCDGYAYHGNPETLELDAKKRNFLQLRGGSS